MPEKRFEDAFESPADLAAFGCRGTGAPWPPMTMRMEPLGVGGCGGSTDFPYPVSGKESPSPGLVGPGYLDRFVPGPVKVGGGVSLVR